MSSEKNALGQVVGLPVADVFPRPWPSNIAHKGRYVRLEPLRESHAGALFEAFCDDPDGRGWTYMPLGAWQSPDDALKFCRTQQGIADPMFFCVIDEAGQPSGFCSYLRITPALGSIEVGWIHFAPRLQRSRAATEAIYVLMAHAFDDLGYRRFEWKCDALNAASRAAAKRFGFTYEGTFRQASITKGRNRDTAWYSMIDGEWAAVKARVDAWLAPENFDDQGRQKTRLAP